jgi:hypothetical protein
MDRCLTNYHKNPNVQQSALRIGLIALLIKTLPAILTALTALMKVLLGR